MYLKNKKLKNIPNNIIAKSIDVEIDFLLVFLDADMSNNGNNGNWLNEVMEKDVALKPHYVVEPSKHLPSQHSNPMSDDDEIMGFDIATKKIIRHLTRGTSELDVILTVGMGEQGKMTIARKTAGLEGGVEQEEDNDDNILDYDDDDDEDKEATLVGIKELFGDLGEKMEQCCSSVRTLMS
ncbi:hypothetical protein FXO38_13187 [Capsicum annuum]|nr:hypothetical protein FXO38_13187 [Capsicum annuum]